MKKKLYHLIPFFVLLFSFSPRVFASNLDISNYYYKFDSNLPLLIQYKDIVDQKCSNTNYTGCYVISYGSTMQYTFNTSSNTLEYLWNNSTKTYQRKISGGTNIYRWNSNTNTFNTSCSACNSSAYIGSWIYSTTQDGLMYTTSPLVYNSSLTGYDTVTLPSFTSNVFDDCSIPSIVISNGDDIPTYYSLYSQYCSVPPDDTPLLTSFFSITVEKLQYITEYFSSNYIYLSIFVIFIIVSIILIIKRRLF